MKNILLGGRWSGVAPTTYHRWSPLWVNTYLLNTILGHSHNIRPKPEIEIYTDQFWDVISLLRVLSKPSMALT